MFSHLRRLLLGILLILGASALLLFSDLSSRVAPKAAREAAAAETKTGRIAHVAFMQHASQFILDQGRTGLLAGMAERGWTVGKNLDFKIYNPQGDIATAQTVAKAMVSGDADMLLTVSTLSFQAVANANKGIHKTHVFALVTDPYGAGVGISRTNHRDHPAHLAGYGTMQPIAEAFELARAMRPELATVGVVWNSAEANAEAQIKLARVVCAKMGIKLIEATVDNSSGVGEAASALAARGAEALMMLGDVTVLTAVEPYIAAGRKARIPMFSVVPPQVQRGALFDIGADYTEVGRQAGLLAGDILNGRSPADVAIDNMMPKILAVNLAAPATFKDRWTIPASLRSTAQIVVDEKGVLHDSRPVAAAPAPAIPHPVPGRTYRVGFAFYAPELGVETCQRGLLDGLKELGFVEGQNLTIVRSHAQGEVVNIQPMILNLDSTPLDVIVPMSTPVIQSTITGVKHKPVVFTYCTDPIAAGVGRSFTEHSAHMTGIGSLPPIDDTVKIIRRVLPQAKRLGTLYNSGEANSRKIIGLLRESTKAQGLELVELTAANSNEVFQAMQALVARHIDAFYLPSDNTGYQAYDAIRKVTTEAKLPLIVDDPDYVSRGAFFACGPGFYFSGKAAAPLIARVLLGESPAHIPMANVSVNATKFNQESIARLGLTISPALIHEIETAGSTSAAPAPSPAAPASPNPTGKKWKVALVLYNETPPAEETLAGMKEGWKHSRLVEGRDYEIKMRSSQGDMAALSGIMDAALTDGADILVPFSTPTLQIAVRKVRRIPIIFSLVSDPMKVGAGKSYTDHLPNITGISVLTPVAQALDMLQKYFPGYKKIGTLFCPAEVNSVVLKDSLLVACRERGITLEVVAANSAAEVADAAVSLASRPIDAVVQISDNLSASTFPAIVHAARQAQKPLISLNSTSVKLGSPVAFGRDYHACGLDTVNVIERVIAGESTANIPFSLSPKIVFDASAENARAVGMTLPAALLQAVAAAK